MTRETAIKEIKDRIELEWRHRFPADLAPDYIEALEMAVEALQKQERDEMMEEYFEYLDGLRESGVTNMFGAGEYLEVVFGLDKRYARTVLSEWMRTFGERHKD